jgi:hypothetical protein
MDMKPKTYDIRTSEKTFFSLDIFFINIDTLVQSLDKLVETRIFKDFECCLSSTSATPFHHLLLSDVLEKISRSSCEPLYVRNTSHRKQESFLYEHPLHWIYLPTRKTHNRALLFCSTPSSTVAILKRKPFSEHAHARLLPRLSSWSVLLPSDTHRKPNTSITAALLPFFTYLLIPPRTWTVSH